MGLQFYFTDHMKNPFAAFNIEHLSPSSCNQWAASPAMFLLQRVAKRAGAPVGAGAYRGSAVEAGISHGLVNPTASLSDCVGRAISEFRTLSSLSTDPRADKELASLEGMVTEGLKALRPYGPPTAVQGAVKHHVEGLAVPLVGFFDFQFGDTIVDLKTTHAIPASKGISTAHARQVSLYVAATDGVTQGRVAYVSSKKSETFQLEQAADHLAALEKIALTIQKFLSISDDPVELCSYLTPDIDSFYVGSDPITRQTVFELFKV